MKRLGIACIALLLCVGIIGCSSTKEEKIKIGVVQISEHESLNIVREAALKEIKKQGYDKDNCEIIYKNAANDPSTLKTIVEGFNSDKVDVIMAIATPSAQAAAPYAKDIPVVFGAVSNPVESGLVKALDKTDGNITGTSNEIQVDQILDLGFQMYPEIKTLGLLYSSQESNAVVAIEKAKAYAKEHGIAIVETAITSTSEVSQATNTLVDKADAIFIPNDNNVISAMENVTSITCQNKIPTFCGVDTFIKAGGLMNVGIDYASLGKETGSMVVAILKGKEVKDMPIKVFKTNLNVYINKTTASTIGFDVTSLQTDKEIVYFE